MELQIKVNWAQMQFWALLSPFPRPELLQKIYHSIATMLNWPEIVISSFLCHLLM